MKLFLKIVSALLLAVVLPLGAILVEAHVEIRGVDPAVPELAELRDAPVLDMLRGELSPAARHRLATDAPEHVVLPSGRRTRIDYTSAAAPFVAARLQEFFGLAETPRIAGGRVPLLLHLLGPNHRPVQITADLSSFWENTYPSVAKELRRRYPRHSWPMDPLTSPAESRPRRRK